MLKFVCLGLSLLAALSIRAMAETAVPLKNPVAHENAAKARHCPPVDKLIRDERTLRWYTTNGWKSSGESFSTKIDSFVMARWVGVNVGKIVCLYQGNIAGTFPIALERSNLMEDPTGLRWGRYHDGYKDCVSASVWECPFFAREVQQPVDIYDEIRSLKKEGDA